MSMDGEEEAWRANLALADQAPNDEERAVRDSGCLLGPDPIVETHNPTKEELE